jgi:hypothetical protein
LLVSCVLELLLLRSSSQFRLTFVDFHPTSASFHPTSVRFCPTFVNVYPCDFVGPAICIHRSSSIIVHPRRCVVFFKSYVLCTYVSYHILQTVCTYFSISHIGFFN